MAKDVVVKPTIEMLVEGSTTIVSDTTKGTTLTRKLEQGKGSLISEDEVLAYIEISAVAHEFAAVL